MRNPSDFFVQNPNMSFSDSLHQFFSVPKFEDFNTEMSKRIGEQRRQQLSDSCPINRETISAAKYTADEALAYFGLWDFLRITLYEINFLYFAVFSLINYFQRYTR